MEYNMNKNEIEWNDRARLECRMFLVYVHERIPHAVQNQIQGAKLHAILKEQFVF